MDTNPELMNTLTKALTYKIKRNIPGATHFSQFEIVKNYKVINKTIISFPTGRLDLIPENYEITDKRILEPMPFPKASYP